MLDVSPHDIELIYPIIGLQIVPGIGLVINRKSTLKGLQPRGNRRKIAKLSKRSLYNMLLTVRAAKGIVWKSMLTLTYSEQTPTNGKTVKRNLDYAIRFIKRNFCKGLMYFWFQEFQKRGAPHYHVVMNYLPTPIDVIRFIAYWVELQGLQDWPYSRISDRKLFYVKQAAIDFNSHINDSGQYDIWQELRNKKDGAVRYALKYASKPKQKVAPFWFNEPGRFWGTNLPKPEFVRVDSCVEDVRWHLEQIGHPAAKWGYLPKVILYRGNVS